MTYSHCLPRSSEKVLVQTSGISYSNLSHMNVSCLWIVSAPAGEKCVPNIDKSPPFSWQKWHALNQDVSETDKNQYVIFKIILSASADMNVMCRFKIVSQNALGLEEALNRFEVLDELYIAPVPSHSTKCFYYRGCLKHLHWHYCYYVNLRG